MIKCNELVMLVLNGNMLIYSENKLNFRIFSKIKGISFQLSKSSYKEYDLFDNVGEELKSEKN